MDASTGMDPKEALDKALSDQMMNISQKKKIAAKERVKNITIKIQLFIRPSNKNSWPPRYEFNSKLIQLEFNNIFLVMSG